MATAKKTTEERATERASKKAVTEILAMLVQVESATVAQIVSTTGVAKSTVGKILNDMKEQGKADSKRPDPKAAAEWSLLPEEAAAAVAPKQRRVRNDGAPARPRGELRQQVHAMLAGRPGDELGPSEVSKFLGGASVGAITNALETMTADATSGIKQTQDKPRRFAYIEA